MAHLGRTIRQVETHALEYINRLFPDDETAEAWFIHTRWPDGMACPLFRHSDFPILQDQLLPITNPCASSMGFRLPLLKLYLPQTLPPDTDNCYNFFSPDSKTCNTERCSRLLPPREIEVLRTIEGLEVSKKS